MSSASPDKVNARLALVEQELAELKRQFEELTKLNSEEKGGKEQISNRRLQDE